LNKLKREPERFVASLGIAKFRRIGRIELPYCKKEAAGSYPAPEGDGMHAHPKPKAVE
jgi:hypothetical protein